MRSKQQHRRARWPLAPSDHRACGIDIYGQAGFFHPAANGVEGGTVLLRERKPADPRPGRSMASYIGQQV